MLIILKMEHVRSLLAKRTKKCTDVTVLCRCEKKLKARKDCEECKNRPKCVEEAPLICNDCLHEVLKSEFDSWSSGNVQIDEFIRNAQRSLSYIRYPEWIPHNFFTEIKCVNRGEFGAVISAKWSQGTKAMQTSDNVRHYFRSDPCAVVLKKLKDMKQLSLIKIQHQDPKNCCNLYGITQDLSTLEYMLVEPASVCDGCLSNVLVNEFSNWTSGNLQIDEFIQEAQRSSTYVKYPEWIPYDSLSEIKYINRGGFAGDIYSLGIILWELVCGIPAFSNRAHCVNLITDICNGLRPKTCLFAPPTYNDLLKKCWNQNPSERPSINSVIDCIQLLCSRSRYMSHRTTGIDIYGNPKKLKFLTTLGCIEELTLDEYKLKYYPFSYDKNQFEKQMRELKNSDNATRIYNVMKWKPDIPIHSEAVYKSRMISVSNEYMTRQNDMTLQYEVCDIPEVDEIIYHDG
ncbi:kinase-like protein [Gigaspora margarita]|uniref:Kinase-like protein n=1 Tax=Gigaspora margarita TaxID=4874 RepID=A0A8H4B2G6_GIGMA|nr:kinase-like protein [Gigaspora margarita]